jgi:hypothetical protein
VNNVKRKGKQNSWKCKVSKEIKIPSKAKKVFAVPFNKNSKSMLNFYQKCDDVWDLFCCHKLYLIL